MFHNCTIEQLLFWLKGTVGTQFGTPAPRKASTTLLVTRYMQPAPKQAAGKVRLRLPAPPHPVLHTVSLSNEAVGSNTLSALE